MKIKEILKQFNKELNKICTEENQHKTIAFKVTWRSTKYTTNIIDMNESYWYLEDDGTIVFRINDDIGVDDEYKLKTGTLIEFKNDLNRFLRDYGDEDQIDYLDIDMIEAKDIFYFYTADGSYWVAEEFQFIIKESCIIIDITDWG